MPRKTTSMRRLKVDPSLLMSPPLVILSHSINENSTQAERLDMYRNQIAELQSQLAERDALLREIYNKIPSYDSLVYDTPEMEMRRLLTDILHKCQPYRQPKEGK